MFKIMVLLKHRPDLSMEQFIERYEADHAPAHVRRQHHMKRYRRYYLRGVPYALDGKETEPHYDLVSQLWFEDKQSYEADLDVIRMMLAGNAEGGGQSLIDPSKSNLAFLEVHQTDLPGANREDYKLRSIILLKRRPDITMEAFIHHYETTHAQLGFKYAQQDLYRRHFLHAAPNPLNGKVAEPAYDVVTEACYTDAEARKRSRISKAHPDVIAIFEADEANFIDKRTRQGTRAETYDSVLARSCPL